MRSFPAFFYHNSRKDRKTMTKASYMALADFQTLWTSQIKPAVQMKLTFATVEVAEAVIDELE